MTFEEFLEGARAQGYNFPSLNAALLYRKEKGKEKMFARGPDTRPDTPLLLRISDECNGRPKSEVLPFYMGLSALCLYLDNIYVGISGAPLSTNPDKLKKVINLFNGETERVIRYCCDDIHSDIIREDPVEVEALIKKALEKTMESPLERVDDARLRLSKAVNEIAAILVWATQTSLRGKDKK